MRSICFTFLLSFIFTITSAQEAAEPNTVKVLTFNILHGATTRNNYDLDRIAQVIKDADPDFVALQEVDFKTNRAKGYDLVTELGWRTKMAPIFARAMSYDGGEYGEGVLSKLSFLSTRNIPLPYTGDHEPRAALEVTIILPVGDTICFVGTHLDHLPDPADRIKQVKELNKVLLKNEHPTILAGDLNDVPASIPIKLLLEHWQPSYDTAKPTFPSNHPEVKIDYILTYPVGKWHVLNREVLCDTVASDHCAYLVTLTLAN